jgi:integrase
VPLSRVTHEDTAAWVSELIASGLAPATVRYIYRVFSLLLELAVKSSRIHRNPAAGVRLPRVQPADKRFLTHEQVGALADACGDYRTAVLLLAYCGLRWGELAGLKVGRVDLLRRRVEVAEAVSEVRGSLVWGTPKSHQRRSVPLPRFLVDDLAVALAGKSPDDLVFTTRRGAVLRNLNFRRDVLDDAAASVGLAGLTPHELRHTAASLAVSAGANVKAVQRMLGHASAAMTLDVYSGLFDDDLDGVADRLDATAVPRVCPEAAVLDLADRRQAL